jgi:1-acyl-sn-glycerol-3-phosphate acyltransferase
MSMGAAPTSRPRLTPATRIGARVGHGIGIGLFGAGYRTRTPGRELVPRTGPVLLAVNHTAFLDAPLVVSVTGRPVHVFSKAELFHGPLGVALRAIGQIPIHRDTPDRTALLTGLEVLLQGGVLAVFPEGSRGKGDFSDTRDGLAWLAMRSGAPVVPVVCLGTGAGTSTVRGIARPLSVLTAAYGEPFTVPVPSDRPRSRAALTAGAALVRERLVAHHERVHDQARRGTET